jgi:hypothetical protein
MRAFCFLAFALYASVLVEYNLIAAALLFAVVIAGFSVSFGYFIRLAQ